MGLLDRLRRSSATATTPPPAHSAVPSPVATTPEVDNSSGPDATTGARGATVVPDPDRTHLGTWLDLAPGEIGQFPDAVERIYAGTLDGVSIRGVFTPEEVAVGVARARTHSDEFVDHGTTIMFGTALVGSDDDRADYYVGAPTINDRIDGLFDVDFVGRVSEVLSGLAGGRPAVVPSEADRGEYVPATVRFLPPGRGVMHAHTANEFCNAWGAFSHLREIATMWNSLSYFVVGQAPDSGGDLVLYDLMWDDTPEPVLSLGMGAERDSLLEPFGTTPIRLGPGDMILFTGGRIWHRVEPVEGSRERVTIGGFAALAQDDEAIYFWS